MAFTLSRQVNSVNDIEVLVNNVEQQPNTVYTVVGTTLTFTTAPSAGTQNIYVRYLSTVSQSIVPSQGTVNTAQLGLITTIPTTGGNTITLPASTGTALVAPTELTVPNTTGTVMVSGNMPAFSAYMSALQSTTAGTTTKLQFNTLNFDTNSNYSTTNYRFTPTVAGYYQFSLALSGNDSGAGGVQLRSYFYKNGAQLSMTQNRDTVGQPINLSQSTIAYMNGTTDYVEVYGLNVSGTGQFLGGNAASIFSGAMVRSA